jgi:hypothetical protein
VEDAVLMRLEVGLATGVSTGVLHAG